MLLSELISYSYIIKIMYISEIQMQFLHHLISHSFRNVLYVKMTAFFFLKYFLPSSLKMLYTTHAMSVNFNYNSVVL